MNQDIAFSMGKRKAPTKGKPSIHRSAKARIPMRRGELELTQKRWVPSKASRTATAAITDRGTVVLRSVDSNQRCAS